jgi:hypothetical protein
MNQIIISILQNKFYIIVGIVTSVLCSISYNTGLKHGFIPPEIQCKDTLMIVDQCKIDKADQQKTCTSDLIKCNAECKIDTCDKICSDKVRDALNNYKILLTDIKCGSIK